MPYLGNEPAVAYTSTTKDSFSGDASTTDFTLSKSANVNAVRVVVENVVQDPGVAYTCSGTTLTFTSAPPTGTNNIYVVHLGPPAATVAPPSTINNPTTFTDDVTVGDDLLLNSDSAVLSIGADADLKITHDGTNGDFESAGDLTFDVAGDIILDADGGDFQFKDDGTLVLNIENSSGDIKITNVTSDKDLIFRGVDGGSAINALSLDMSAAGNATFNGTVAAADGSVSAPSIRGTDTNTGLFFPSGGVTAITRNGVEGCRMDSSGNLIVGRTASGHEDVGGMIQGIGRIYSTVSTNFCFTANRLGNDGDLIRLQQETTTEGTISVSGTTVSYNGGHLSRWSQLSDNTKDTSIVKGTVMTNLDQMAVWNHEASAATYYKDGDELPEGVSVGDEKTPAIDAWTEDNEQLNCMTVSSVEGDPNVAGVFVNWDEDDEDFLYDMNVAMTGDMVIRIAKGVTVARGDLLMSAGDGTAKPQGDDIVRNKTIAKVTSTNVSHTYDDESYLVPCVLMAC